MNRRHVLAALVVLLPMSACGKPGVQIGAVRGTVKMEGRPLPKALLRFAPEGGGRSAQGITDDQGHYTLSYTARLSGALVGKNKVMITTGPLEDVSRKSESVPKQYNDETTLIVDVQAGENTFDFDLEPKKK